MSLGMRFPPLGMLACRLFLGIGIWSVLIMRLRLSSHKICLYEYRLLDWRGRNGNNGLDASSRRQSELTRWLLSCLPPLPRPRKKNGEGIYLVDTLGGTDGLYSPHLLFHAEQNDHDRHQRPAQHL